MSVSLSGVPVKEAKAAAAFMLEMKPEELTGYIVVGIRTDGDYDISSNADCQAHSIAILADVVYQAVRDMADEMPHGNRP